MEISLKYSLRFFSLLLILGINACSNIQKNEEHKELGQAKLEASWKYYQGSVKNMNLLEESVQIDSENNEAWRELSIPYLKRGYPDKWYLHYQKAINSGATNWIGARGCDYLFFYRDYKRALQDFNALDTLTPNFTDYPQATSDLYLRALCYYGLKNYSKAITFLDSHIQEQSNSPGGFDFIDPHVFLYKGLAHQQLGDSKKAKEAFQNGLKIFNKSSDLHFHLSNLYLLQNNFSEAEKHYNIGLECFRIGYKNQHNYVEVLEEIHENDFIDLKNRFD